MKDPAQSQIRTWWETRRGFDTRRNTHVIRVTRRGILPVCVFSRSALDLQSKEDAFQRARYPAMRGRGVYTWPFALHQYSGSNLKLLSRI
jgi:hypothetical protein